MVASEVRDSADPFDVCSRGASFDPTERYRYRLWRTVDPEQRRRILWIMLNPSTADVVKDDPTIRRVLDFSGSWGFGRVEVVNLYALRSTDPRALWSAADPVGPHNDAAILAAAREADVVMGAWGAHAKPARVAWVGNLVLGVGVTLACLGTTKNGMPRHPLYVAGATAPRRWEVPRG
jgi:hypothetical protein